MDNYFCAYVAGFVDGEGSISIGKIVHRNYVSKKTGDVIPYDQYHLRVTICQNVKEVLEKIQIEYGGKLKARKPFKNETRTVYYLVFDCVAAKKFLEKIYPYLIVKRKQASIGIEFQNMLADKTLSKVYKNSKKHLYKQEIERLNQAKIWEA